MADYAPYLQTVGYTGIGYSPNNVTGIMQDVPAGSIGGSALGQLGSAIGSTLTSPVTSAANAASNSVSQAITWVETNIGGFVTRIGIVILGFIFVAVALGMFKPQSVIEKVTK